MPRTEMAPPAPPSGQDWEMLENVGPFTQYVGPFFACRADLAPDEPLRLAFRVERHHCNPRLVCHGGMLATFVDLCLARGLLEVEDIRGSVPTITMALDYLAPAPMGEWVESRVTLVRRTAQMGFLEVILHCAGRPVVRGNGTYKRPRPPKVAEAAQSSAPASQLP